MGVQPKNTGMGWVLLGERDDSLSGVRVLQLSGPYIFGGLDSYAYQFASKDDHIESYFLLDTKTGKHESFLTYEALQGKAQQLGITLNLERIKNLSPFSFAFLRSYSPCYSSGGLCACAKPMGCDGRLAIRPLQSIKSITAPSRRSKNPTN